MSGSAKRGYTVADYAALTHLTRAEAARTLGVTRAAVTSMVNRYGLVFAPKPRPAAERAPRVDVSPTPKGPAARPVRRACDDGLRPAMTSAPAWDAARDGRILETKGRYAAIADLAASWQISTSSVMTRWHVLRASR